MGLLDFFKKKPSETLDPLADLTLPKLKKGFFVDYDMRSWNVTECNYYDWGSGDLTYEWQLKGADETIYLEREPDDEDYWSISRKIPVTSLDNHVIDHIISHENPPSQIVYNNTTYTLAETGGGHFYTSDKETGRELIKWDYEDDTGENFLSIEQWGEKDFEASIGYTVEAYQFTNILPGNM